MKSQGDECGRIILLCSIAGCFAAASDVEFWISAGLLVCTVSHDYLR
jgi:hypothetical protein